MVWAVRLGLIEDAEGWRVSLSAGGGRPFEARVSRDSVDALEAAVQASIGDVPAVLVPGRDAARTEAEERAGRALSSLLSGGPLAPRWAWHLGLAQGRGEPLVIVVDVPGAARRLPWELVSPTPRDGPLEASATGTVVRLVDGPPRPPRHGQALRVVTFAPDGDEPQVREVLAGLAQVCAAFGLAPPVSAQDCILAPGDVVALHVVSHGQRVGEHVRLLIGQGDRGAGSAAHVLAPVLERAALAVLDVCEGAHAGARELDTPAARLLAAGVPAVVAPRLRADTRAARSFDEALLGALAQGATVIEGVAAGRRAVAGLALPHPDGRWANFGLFVASLDPLHGGAVQATCWRPAGWPNPSPEAARVLADARLLAERTGAGFVGWEHLLRALDGASLDAPSVRLRVQLQRGLGEAEGRLGQLRPLAGGRADWAGTPRLRRLATQLRPGFTAGSLLRALTAEPPWAALLQLDGEDVYEHPDFETVQTQAGERTGTVSEPAAALEVVGGPEDGRRVALQPGQVLGRGGPKGAADHRLYGQAFLCDPFLSRAALVWQGDRVEARKARRLRAGRWSVVEASCDLRVGDVLALSSATHVAGVA